MFWWRPPCVLRTVIVVLRSDDETALRGVLWQSRGPWLVLRDVELLKPAAAPARVDGDAVVHRDNVAFLQVP